jgi:hypothetical protein
MYDLEKIVNDLNLIPSDINEHIPTLIKYGNECDHITEMGVRGIMSTWAFLASSPKKLISYDIENPTKFGGDINSVYETAKQYGIDFQFIQANVRDITIEQTDLLFLDTWHVYEQLQIELKLHSPKANKYIILHDTTTYEIYGESPYYDVHGKQVQHKGLWPAIEEFLKDNSSWVLHERFVNNNGLTILKRK